MHHSSTFQPKDSYYLWHQNIYMVKGNDRQGPVIALPTISLDLYWPLVYLVGFIHVTPSFRRRHLRIYEIIDKINNTSYITLLIFIEK